MQSNRILQQANAIKPELRSFPAGRIRAPLNQEKTIYQHAGGCSQLPKHLWFINGNGGKLDLEQQINTGLFKLFSNI